MYVSKSDLHVAPCKADYNRFVDLDTWI